MAGTLLERLPNSLPGRLHEQFQSRSWTHNRLGRLSHKPLRRLKSSWNCRELRKTVKAVGRGRNRLGRLRTGRNARGGYGIDGWGGNHPKHSFYGDFRGTRTVTLFSTRVLDREERKHRKRPSEINPDGKEGESWPEGRSESQLETAGPERTEGKEPRERDRRIRTGILGHTTVQASMVDAGPPCSAATGSDPYTNGSRLGCREMVPESDGLILRILPDGRRVLTRLIRRNSDRVPAFCTGHGIEPSVDGSVMTGPRLVLDDGRGERTGSRKTKRKKYMDGLSNNKAPRQDLILGVIKSDLHFVWANYWKQQKGLLKSMEPDSEVKKRERLTKSLLKLKEGKPAGVRIESSGSRKQRMLGESLSKPRNFQRPKSPKVEIIRTRDWKSGVLAKDLLDDQGTTQSLPGRLQEQFQSRSWSHNRLGRLSHKPLRRLKSSWNCRELRKTVKAVGRGRNRLGRLQTGRDARGSYGIDGWGRNRPKHSFYGDFWGTRTVTLFSTQVLDREESKQRKRPREINPDGKGESWPEGRSESQLETAGLSREGTEGKEPRERQTDPNRDIRPDDVQASVVDAGPPFSDATGSDPYTNGSRLGCRKMVPESDGLILRILPDGRRVLTRLIRRNSDRVPAFCTGHGIEPSVDGSVMTGPILVLDDGRGEGFGYVSHHADWIRRMGSSKTERKKYMDGLSYNKAPRQNVSKPSTDRLECDDRNTDKPSSVTTQRPNMHTTRSLRSDRACVPFGRYVVTEIFRNVDTTRIHAFSSTL
ncbi:hypothetical protein IGI04_015426 [Brassica rapa subsp. trilocularis]|uniref:Uncharacterized protein n=1 Tax=Brassica rapa subsp. trilocularis TaxID=1813537 RepID=A0ABQ7MQ07_BRACM|nr:hypothetical protein IGI04_015426 [Brassica rapa subsp. trilocularis]